VISLYSDNGSLLTRYPLKEVTSTYVNFSRSFLDSKKSFLLFLNCSLKLAPVRSLCRHAAFNPITYFKTDTGGGHQSPHHYTDNKEAFLRA